MWKITQLQSSQRKKKGIRKDDEIYNEQVVTYIIEVTNISNESNNELHNSNENNINNQVNQVQNEIPHKKTYLVYAIVFSILKNKDDSEDITHEIFTKIYKLDVNKLPTNNESSWLFTVSKNECYLYLRKSKPNINIEEIYEIPESSNDIDKIIDIEYYNKLIKGLKDLNNLPDKITESIRRRWQKSALVKNEENTQKKKILYYLKGTEPTNTQVVFDEITE